MLVLPIVITPADSTLKSNRLKAMGKSILPSAPSLPFVPVPWNPSTQNPLRLESETIQWESVESPVPGATPRRKDGGLPHDAGGIDPPPAASTALFALLLQLPVPLLQEGIAHHDDPLSLVIAEHLEHFQLLVDVLFRHGGEGGQLGDGGAVLVWGGVEADFGERGGCRGGGGSIDAAAVGAGLAGFGREADRVREQLDEGFAPVLAVA